MSLTSYADLKAAIAAYAHADDLTTQYDTFVTLAEARFNRFLRTRAMENTLASTALASGAITLPTGFLAFKELRYDATPTYALEPRPLQWVRNHADLASAPRYFAISGTQVLCWPQTGNVKGTYYKAIDSLVSTVNWLFTAYPDLYLFACLEESAIYTRDYEAGAIWGKRTQVLLDEIQSADNANAINGGPLTTRAR